MLQFVAVFGSVLQRGLDVWCMCCSALQYVAVCCGDVRRYYSISTCFVFHFVAHSDSNRTILLCVLQYVAAWCVVLQRVAVWCNILHCVVVM